MLLVTSVPYRIWGDWDRVMIVILHGSAYPGKKQQLLSPEIKEFSIIVVSQAYISQWFFMTQGNQLSPSSQRLKEHQPPQAVMILGFLTFLFSPLMSILQRETKSDNVSLWNPYSTSAHILLILIDSLIEQVFTEHYLSFRNVKLSESEAPSSSQTRGSRPEA